jgi:hypothetical protein
VLEDLGEGVVPRQLLSGISIGKALTIYDHYMHSKERRSKSGNQSVD